jgi:hypothetical protein
MLRVVPVEEKNILRKNLDRFQVLIFLQLFFEKTFK